MILFFIIEFLTLFYILYFISFFVYYYLKNHKNNSHSFVKNVSKKDYKLLRLPIQLALDFANRDSNAFEPHGIILFCGRQGAGKTISMIKYATDIKYIYPQCKVLSNTEFTLADVNIVDSDIIVKTENGNKGVLVLIDELQLWFNSKLSKSNLDFGWLGCLCQNRKQRRVICGTAQQFYMVQKDIRTQCTTLVQCYTILGCVTFNLWFTPIVDNEGNTVKKRFRKLTWFIQNDELRHSYDTYKTITSIYKAGANERSLNNGKQ